MNDKYLKELLIVSSDINVYIFHNSAQGLICLYELKSRTQIDKKLYEEEIKLSENALSTLPINQVLVKERVKQISCGKEHILILSESKKMYSLGIGTKGQLGHGKIENCFDEPILVNTFEHKISAISAGGWHSGAIDENGSCFMWGWNSEGQVGVVNDENVFITKPTRIVLIDDLTSKELKFKKLSLGSRHSALVDMQNNLYVFGWNKYKQLMLDFGEKESNLDEPLKCVQFDQNVIDVKCGVWFTLVKLS
jgi:alpha-tubulin suppressor-like RCC1 family protein